MLKPRERMAQMCVFREKDVHILTVKPAGNKVSIELL